MAFFQSYRNVLKNGSSKFLSYFRHTTKMCQWKKNRLHVTCLLPRKPTGCRQWTGTVVNSFASSQESVTLIISRFALFLVNVS